MNSKGFRLISRIMVLLVMLSMVAAPLDVHAMAKKSKAKYSVKVHNINSNTVLKKGTKIRIQYTATKKKNGVVSPTKVKFKSSNKKVATVSKKGTIKAKKKGTVKITVYCKKNPKKKKTVKIRVGTPVKSITIHGSNHLRKGRSNTFSTSFNKGVTNKKVSWWSDNTAVATVNSSGKVTTKAVGTATIYAKAKDGSGVIGSRKVYVRTHSKTDAHWIAHRGLHSSAKENTAAAFEAAGKAGFWGCECDIRKTKADDYQSEALPQDPGPAEPEEPAEEPESGAPDVVTESGDQQPDGSQQGDGQTGDDQTGDDQPATGSDPVDETDEEVEAVISAINALGLDDLDDLEVIDKADEIKAAKQAYDALKNEPGCPQKYNVYTGLESEGKTNPLKLLLEDEAKIKEYESFDFVINHDASYSRTMGYDRNVADVTSETVRAKLPKICFFDTYLEICKRYGMVPIVEFKNKNNSDLEIKKAIDMIEDHGLLEEVVLISFHEDNLKKVMDYTNSKLGGSGAVTYFLFSDDWKDNLEIARKYGFTGVSVKKTLISSSFYSKAKAYGLGVGSYTYESKASDDEYLYQHLLSGKYDLDFVTMDYKVF